MLLFSAPHRTKCLNHASQGDVVPAFGERVHQREGQRDQEEDAGLRRQRLLPRPRQRGLDGGRAEEGNGRGYGPRGPEARGQLQHHQQAQGPGGRMVTREPEIHLRRKIFRWEGLCRRSRFHFRQR